MDLPAYRKRESLTQQDVADRLSLSKGHIANIELGHDVAGFRLALQLDEMTGGDVPAESLLTDDDSALLGRFLERRRVAAAA